MTIPAILIIFLFVSVLMFSFGNGLVRLAGLAFFCVSVFLWFVYGFAVGFSVLFSGLYALMGALGLTGVALISIAIVLFLFGLSVKKYIKKN